MNTNSNQQHFESGQRSSADTELNRADNGKFASHEGVLSGQKAVGMGGDSAATYAKHGNHGEHKTAGFSAAGDATNFGDYPSHHRQGVTHNQGAACDCLPSSSTSTGYPSHHRKGVSHAQGVDCDCEAPSSRFSPSDYPAHHRAGVLHSSNDGCDCTGADDVDYGTGTFSMGRPIEGQGGHAEGRTHVTEHLTNPGEHKTHTIGHEQPRTGVAHEQPQSHSASAVTSTHEHAGTGLVDGHPGGGHREHKSETPYGARVDDVDVSHQPQDSVQTEKLKDRLAEHNVGSTGGNTFGRSGGGAGHEMANTGEGAFGGGSTNTTTGRLAGEGGRADLEGDAIGRDHTLTSARNATTDETSGLHANKGHSAHTATGTSSTTEEPHKTGLLQKIKNII